MQFRERTLKQIPGGGGKESGFFHFKSQGVDNTFCKGEVFVFHRYFSYMFRGKWKGEALTLFVANAIGGTALLAVNIIGARCLSLAAYAQFAVALSLITFLVQVQDLGLNTAFVRYFVRESQESPERARALYRKLLIFRLVVAAFLLLLGFVLGPWLVRPLLGEPFWVLWPAVLGGALGGGFFVTSQVVRQAERRLNSYGLFAIANNLCRLGVVVIAALLGYRSASGLAGAFSLGIFVAFLLALPGLVQRYRGDVDLGGCSFSDLFHFGKWTFVSLVTVLFLAQTDIWLLKILSSDAQVSHYNTALRLAMVFPLITTTIVTMLLPKVSGLQRDELAKYVQRTFSWAPILVAFLALAVLLAGWVVVPLFGTRYADAVVLLRWLLGAFFISVLINPLSLVLYNLEKPHLLAGMNLLQLGTNIALNLWWIPDYGALGATWATLLVQVMGGLMVSYFVLREVGWQISLPFRRAAP